MPEAQEVRGSHSAQRTSWTYSRFVCGLCYTPKGAVLRTVHETLAFWGYQSPLGKGNGRVRRKFNQVNENDCTGWGPGFGCVLDTEGSSYSTLNSFKQAATFSCCGQHMFKGEVQTPGMLSISQLPQSQSDFGSISHHGTVKNACAVSAREQSTKNALTLEQLPPILYNQ